jgi:nucleotide-binding universal stress UspA family protein
MRALVWIVEDTWEATVAEAAAFLPADAEVTLLHVVPSDVETLAEGSRHGLLGRRPPDEPPAPLRAISDEAAQALLVEARERFGREAALEARRGRVEREVVAGAEGMDILVLARDGDHSRLGPHSLGPPARFVVDHAPCRVLLVWADAPPDVDTIPPPPKHPPEHPPERPPPAHTR